ncbi:MAG: hypothetical protein HOW97_03240 [Catenulispora sp.]|nr:hypothetical protein [Catenulispora sp.]NUR57246.1 hypothetical protein [Catenulispora sp.]
MTVEKRRTRAMTPARPRIQRRNAQRGRLRAMRAWRRQVSAELIRRAAADQQARAAGDFATVDAENLPFLKALVARRGWPGTTALGAEAAQALWLLTQHADTDSALQAECLRLLSAAAFNGQASHTHRAYLEDRVRTNTGQPQLFGTQYRDQRLWPVERPEDLDRRRAQVGLGPHAKYDQTMQALFAAPSNSAPTTPTGEQP